MTTRSTRGAVPLALAFATLACAWLAVARPAAAAPADASAVAAATATSAPASAAAQYAVKPGQSLADIAATATQSRDKAVIGRAAKAIFDANPSAFMRGDPSLLKLGAVLNVPPLDATGAVVKNEVAPSAASGSASGAASATVASASQPAAAAKPNRAQAGNAASASSASSLAPASSLATSPGSVAAAASAPAKAAAPAAVHAQPGVPVGASGEHAWSGAIEPAPVAPASATAEGAASAVPTSGTSAPAAAASQGASTTSSAAGASAAVAGAASGTHAEQGASTAAAASAAASHPKVSSLQQLLTLKNRVLMELQRHGFGTSSSARSGASGSAPASAVGFAVAPAASGVVAPAPGRSRAAAAANQRFIGIGGVGFGVPRDDLPALAATAAAVVAALVVLLGAIGISRRKRRNAVSAHKAAGSGAPGAAVAAGDEPAAPIMRPVAAVDDPIEAELLAILARNPSSKRALMGLAARYAERKNVGGFDEIAQRIYRLSGGRGPNWVHVAALGRQLDPDNALFALGVGETDDAVLTNEQPGDAQIEPADEAGGTSAPPMGLAPGDTRLPGLTGDFPPTPPATEPALPSDVEGEAGAHDAEPVREPVPEPGPEPRAEAEPTAEAPSREAEPHLMEPHGTELQEAETREAQSHEAVSPEAESTTPQRPEATLPPEAIAALGDLDFGLPPRIESDADHEAQPLAQALSEESESEDEHEPADVAAGHEAHTQPPAHVEPAERIEPQSEPAPAVPEARPSVAGLGAAPIGPLSLSFDLDLPGAEAGGRDGSMAASAPLPQFTPEQLARIARNKLELAAEYIALGDLGGARTLINEVIESNDAATRDEAHALLATLAPLS